MGIRDTQVIKTIAIQKSIFETVFFFSFCSFYSYKPLSNTLIFGYDTFWNTAPKKKEKLIGCAIERKHVLEVYHKKKIYESLKIENF